MKTKVLETMADITDIVSIKPLPPSTDTPLDADEVICSVYVVIFTFCDKRSDSHVPEICLDLAHLEFRQHGFKGQRCAS